LGSKKIIGFIKTGSAIYIGAMEEWCPQVFYWPGHCEPQAPGIILSAGVHGDETGPIELLTALQQDLLQGRLQLRRPLLLIFGNLTAMAVRQRFVQENMNRLFQSPPPVGNASGNAPGAEAQRAQSLMEQCQRFAGQCGSLACHLDLHSTIKPSLIERFALMPVPRQSFRYQWAGPLARAGFGARVEQTRPAHTFSQFSHTQLGADSFTLECGSHGISDTASQTDEAASPLQAWLWALLAFEGDFATALQTVQAQVAAAELQRFRVAEEIIRQDASFRFLIDEQEANFSAHPAGTPLFEQQQQIWTTPGTRYSLFLNAGVAPGQRAGLLLKRVQ